MNPVIDIPEPVLLGLHALVGLARHEGECMSSKLIAESLGASEGHLSKVLQRLSRAGYLDSIHGPGGGYVLDKKPEDITLLEIVETLSGPFTLEGCGFPRCKDKTCLIGELMDQLTTAVKEYLRTHNLAGLLRSYGERPRLKIALEWDDGRATEEVAGSNFDKK